MFPTLFALPEQTQQSIELAGKGLTGRREWLCMSRFVAYRCPFEN
jgi:hypothetical protein